MGNGGFGYAWLGIVGFLVWLIVLIDLILVGIWLWQNINKGRKR